MPTYDYQCHKCLSVTSRIQTIRQYVDAPIRPECCGQEMERRLSVDSNFSGLANAMAGDRHYDGMRAPDGTDISSRTKHRQYMKEKGVTTADDFTGVWAKSQQERELFRMGKHQDKDLHREIESQVLSAVAQPN